MTGYTVTSVSWLISIYTLYNHCFKKLPAASGALFLIRSEPLNNLQKCGELWTLFFVGRYLWFINNYNPLQNCDMQDRNEYLCTSWWPPEVIKNNGTYFLPPFNVMCSSCFIFMIYFSMCTIIFLDSRLRGFGCNIFFFISNFYCLCEQCCSALNQLLKLFEMIYSYFSYKYVDLWLTPGCKTFLLLLSCTYSFETLEFYFSVRGVLKSI